MTRVLLPAGAGDTHVHVFRPDLYPYARDRAYTPGKVTAAELSSFLDGHGLERVVIVQPSVYGADNRALIDALRELGTARARGIAVVDIASIADEALADLDSAGIVGVRLNVATRADHDLSDAVLAADARLAGSRWHIQIFASQAAVIASAATLARLQRPFVLDHFGGARIGDNAAPDHRRILIDLARHGAAYIKLSAPYRISGSSQPRWAGVAPLARALIDAVPDRLVWGSDWPHTGGGRNTARAKDVIEPFQSIDDRAALEVLDEWAGDNRMLERILVETPAALYRFD